MDTYTLFFDGSYNPATGDGGWGAVVFHGSVAATPTADLQQNEVTRARGFLDQVGNPTVAEAEALLHGLRLARENILDPICCTLCVHGDCSTAIRALASELLPSTDRLSKTLRTAIGEAAVFGSVNAAWVPRAHNATADYEAGLGSRQVHGLVPLQS